MKNKAIITLPEQYKGKNPASMLEMFEENKITAQNRK